MSCTPISILESGIAHDDDEIRVGHAADLAGARSATPAAAPGGGATGLLRALCAVPGAAFTHRGLPGKTPDPTARDGGVKPRARARHRPTGTRHAESANLWCPDLSVRFPGRYPADRCGRCEYRVTGGLLGHLGRHRLHAPGGHLA